MKQLALACHSYHDANGKLPPAVQLHRSVGNPANFNQPFGPNWAVFILPHIEQDNLFKSQTLNIQNYMTNANTAWRAIRGTRIKTMECPSDVGHELTMARAGGGWARGNYGANTGPGMWWIGAPEGAITTVSGVMAESGWNIGGYYASNVQGLALGGPFIVNGGHRINTFPDGTTNTVLIDELRIGPSANDIRGTWAMGQAGASIAAANGRLDTPTPNISQSGWDDIQGGDDRPDIGMGCCSGCGSWQVTAKSRHTGGVVTAFADGSIKFVTNSVASRTWYLLHARNDSQVIPNDF